VNFRIPQIKAVSWTPEELSYAHWRTWRPELFWLLASQVCRCKCK